MTDCENSETVFFTSSQCDCKKSVQKTNVMFVVELAEFEYKTGCDPTQNQQYITFSSLVGNRIYGNSIGKAQEGIISYK